MDDAGSPSRDRSGYVLVTGGAGYIGSHAAKRLLESGRRVLIVDDLSRGYQGAIDRLLTLPGARDRLVFLRAGVEESARVADAMRAHTVREVLHFAGLAYVGESVRAPLLYHRVNTCGTIALLEACQRAGVERFVFSSTCATYGDPPQGAPITERTAQVPVSPYGWSKLAAERALLDVAALRRAEGRPFACAMLRYFNVAGCDRAGLLGEHREPESRLISCAIRVALGLEPALPIMGTDYPTPDGTCIRDFVHVQDLVEAHILALDALEPARFDVEVFNLGGGRGVSVREVVEACRRATGAPIPTAEHPRREGDATALVADSTRAEKKLGWRRRVGSLDEIIASAWAWKRAHPDGYPGPGGRPTIG